MKSEFNDKCKNQGYNDKYCKYDFHYSLGFYIYQWNHYHFFLSFNEIIIISSQSFNEITIIFSLSFNEIIIIFSLSFDEINSIFSLSFNKIIINLFLSFFQWSRFASTYILKIITLILHHWLCSPDRLMANTLRSPLVNFRILFIADEIHDSSFVGKKKTLNADNTLRSILIVVKNVTPI